MLKILEAQKELEKGGSLCPGPWEQHSKSVAQNAMLIAEQTKIMDKEQAYVMGLMHGSGQGVRDGIDARHWTKGRKQRNPTYF